MPLPPLSLLSAALLGAAPLAPVAHLGAQSPATVATPVASVALETNGITVNGLCLGGGRVCINGQGWNGPTANGTELGRRGVNGSTVGGYGPSAAPPDAGAGLGQVASVVGTAPYNPQDVLVTLTATTATLPDGTEVTVAAP